MLLSLSAEFTTETDEFIHEAIGWDGAVGLNCGGVPKLTKAAGAESSVKLAVAVLAVLAWGGNIIGLTTLTPCISGWWWLGGR